MKHKLVLAVAFTLCAISVFSQADSDFIVWKINSNTAISIDGYQGPGGDIVIPDTLLDLPVITINSFAFDGQSTITSVTIPNTVNSIGGFAFADCNTLTNVVMSANLATLGNNAFYRCTALKEISLPGTLSSVGNYVFSKCSGLEEVHLASGITTLGNFMFSLCSNLDTITLPETITTLGTECLYSTKISEITIPGGVHTIPEHAFGYCENLTNVVLQAGTRTIVQYAFDSCYALQKVDLPATVTSIGKKAFERCYNLSEIDLSNVKTIAEETFRECSSLTDITLSSELTHFGPYAFYRCYALTNIVLTPGIKTLGVSGHGGNFSECTTLGSIVIPDSITIIPSSTFASCTALQDVTLPSTLTEIQHYAFLECTALASIDLPATLISILGQAFYECSALESIVIPDNTTLIDYNAFGLCTSLAALDLGSGIATLDDSVFYNCTSLPEVILPPSLTTLGNFVFYNCTALTNAVVQSSAPTLGNSFFYNCKNLEEVTLPATLTSIGNRCFAECHKLSAIAIPPGVTTIGSEAFLYCSDLASINLPIGLTTIQNETFSGCLSLSEVSFPEGLTSIGYSAFRYCRSLNPLSLPTTLTDLGNYAFFDCTNIVEIVIPAGVATVSAYAFSGCYSATNVVLPSGVTTIGSGAFSACTSLATIELPPNLTTIQDDAFYYSGLTSITIPDSVTTLGGWVLNSCANLTNVVLSANIDTLNNSLFAFSTALEKVIIPASVTTINTYVFNGCTSLQGVYFLGNRPNIHHSSNTTPSYYAANTLGWPGENTPFIELPWNTTITFDPQGGTPADITMEYQVGEVLQTLPAVRMPRHDFHGWWTHPDGNGKEITPGSTILPTTERFTLYANWQKRDSEPADYLCEPAETNLDLISSATYDGLLYSVADFDDTEVAAVAGTMTLKLKVTAKATSATAKLMLQSGNLSFKTKAFTPLTEENALYSEIETKNGTLTLFIRENRIWGTLTGGKLGTQVLNLDGCRNLFAEKGNTTAAQLQQKFKGYYTLSLPIADNYSLSNSGFVNSAPDGIGYLGITVGNKGKVKLAGLLADGTKVSRSTTMLAFSDCDDRVCIPLFAPLYSKKGWIGGLLWLDPATRTITTDRDLDWMIRWENPGRRPEAGFRQLLDACGGLYDSRTALASIHELWLTADSTDTGFFDPTTTMQPWSTDLIDLPVRVAGTKLILDKGKKPKRDKASGQLEYHPTNPTVATLAFAAKTGIFKGKYTLWSEYDYNNREQLKGVKVSYFGILTPQRDATFDPNNYPLGMGFSLIPENNPQLKAYKLKRSRTIVLHDSPLPPDI